MNASRELRARGMERKADEFDQRARNLDAEAVAYYRPSSHLFWEETARADRYRKRARLLRQRATELRASACSAQQ